MIDYIDDNKKAVYKILHSTDFFKKNNLPDNEQSFSSSLDSDDDYAKRLYDYMQSEGYDDSYDNFSQLYRRRNDATADKDKATADKADAHTVAPLTVQDNSSADDVATATDAKNNTVATATRTQTAVQPQHAEQDKATTPDVHRPKMVVTAPEKSYNQQWQEGVNEVYNALQSGLPYKSAQEFANAMSNPSEGTVANLLNTYRQKGYKVQDFGPMMDFVTQSSDGTWDNKVANSYELRNLANETDDENFQRNNSYRVRFRSGREKYIPKERFFDVVIDPQTGKKVTKWKDDILTPAWADVEVYGHRGAEKGWLPVKEYIDPQKGELPSAEEIETAKKNNDRAFAYKMSMSVEQAKGLEGKISKMEKLATEEEDKRPHGQFSFLQLNPVQSGGLGPRQTENSDEYNNTMSLLGAARLFLKDAKKLVKEADISRKEGNDIGAFLKGAGRGFVDKLFDVRTWDMGLSETATGLKLIRVLNKADKGLPLSQPEQAMLDAKSIEMATNAYFGSYVGRGYKAGQVTAESLPFMLEMMINPASAIGRSWQSMLTRYALKRFGKSALKKSSGKYLAAKIGARVAGDVVGAGVMAGTTGIGHVASDVLHRQIGDVQFKHNIETGKVEYNGRINKESFGSALYKAYTSQTIENYSEMLGEYFKPILGAAGKGIAKGISKVKGKIPSTLSTSLDAVQEFISGVNKSKFAKAMNDFEKRAKWSGTIPEYAEEVVGNVLNGLLVGDQTFDTDKGTGIFNLDNNIDTFLGVALMGGFMSAVKTAGYRTPKYEAKQAMQKADRAVTKQFENEEEWIAMRYKIENGKNEDIKEVVADVLVSDYDEKKKRAILEYVAKSQYYKGFSQQENTDEQDFNEGEAVVDNDNNRQGQGVDANSNATVTVEGGIQPTQETAQTEQVDPAQAEYDKQRKAVSDELFSGVRNAGLVYVVPGTGQEGVWKMKYRGKEWYVTSDNTDNTAETVKLQDENGNRVVVDLNDPDLDLGAFVPLEQMLDNAMEQRGITTDGIRQRQDFAQRHNPQTKLLNVGDTYTAPNGEKMIIVGEADGNLVVRAAQFDEGQGKYVGDPKSQTRELSQEDAANEQDAYYNSLVHNQPTQQEDAEQSQETAYVKPSEHEGKFGIGDKMTFYVDGKPIEAEVVQAEDVDGVVVQTSERVNGHLINKYTREELDALTAPPQQANDNADVASPRTPEAGAEVQNETEEEKSPDELPAFDGDKFNETHPADEIRQPQEEQKPNEENDAVEASTSSKIPQDESGEYDYMQAEPSKAWAALLEQTDGDADMAREVAQSMLDDKVAELEQAHKQKPKEGKSVAEKIAARKEHKANIERIESEIERWQQIIQSGEDRQAEEKSRSVEAGKTPAGDTKSESGVDGEVKSEDTLQPIGKGVFGNIYDQFKGKVKEAFDFLMKHKSGDLLGVFHRDGFGDIDLVWGDNGGGLAHIIQRHVEEQNDFNSVEEVRDVIDDVIKNGKIVRENADKVNIDYNGYRVSVRKNVRDGQGNIVENKNWVVTAFDRNTPKHEKRRTSSSETLSTPSANQEADGVTLPSNDNSPESKDTKSKAEGQEKSEENKEKEEKPLSEKGGKVSEVVNVEPTEAQKPNEGSNKNEDLSASEKGERKEEVKPQEEQQKPKKGKGEKIDDELDAEEKTYTDWQAKDERDLRKKARREVIEHLDGSPYVCAAIALSGIKITPESFRAHTGYSKSEQAKLVGLIAKKENGGVSMDRAFELAALEFYEQNGYEIDFYEMRDVVLDVLREGNPRGYVKRYMEEQIDEIVNRYKYERDMSYEEKYGMDYDTYMRDPEHRKEVLSSAAKSKSQDTDGDRRISVPEGDPLGGGVPDGKVPFHKAGESNMELTKAEVALRDAVIDRLRENGIDVVTDVSEGQRVLDMANGKERLSGKQKRALETAEQSQRTTIATVVSSADGAKVLNNLDNLAKKLLEKESNRSKTFMGDVARAIGAKEKGSSSQYATFETKNGTVVTIRLANHNAKVSNFDNAGKDNAISIVITRKPNKGMTNDGTAHIVEFYYPETALQRADGKPLAEIVRSIKQALYSGEFKDTTGIAERQEVNGDVVREHRVYHGSGADFEAFDHSHMGEGEGAQAYGWGTYVTEVEGIGRTYAEANSKRPSTHYEYGGDTHGLSEERINEILEVLLDAKPSDGHIVSEYEDALGWYRNRRDEYSQSLVKDASLLNPSDISIVVDKTRNLYSVEIPDDNGKNYLDWNERLSDSQIEAIRAYLSENYRRNKLEDFDASIAESKGAPNADEVNAWARRGENVYKLLSHLLGSDDAASKALSEMGFTGIKYPAENRSGGRKDGARNYVIFNENDAKIVDKVRFFKTQGGEAYGFTVGGKIYIDPHIASSETAVHEYAHLWAEALRSANAKEWENVVGLMRGTSVWNEVSGRYPELKSDDDIADEVLATYSGRRGSERLREEMDRIKGSERSVADKARALGALERVRRALDRFWHGVADFLGIHYKSADEVADRVMRDLLNGVDPRRFVKGESDGRVREQFIGEMGAESADRGNIPEEAKADLAIENFQQVYADYLEGTERLKEQSDKVSADDNIDAIQGEIKGLEDAYDEAYGELLNALEVMYMAAGVSKVDAKAAAIDRASLSRAEVEMRIIDKRFMKIRSHGAEVRPVKPKVTAIEADSKPKPAEYHSASGNTVSFEGMGGLRKLGKGEFAHVERVFTKSGAFSFSGASKIESIDDVAYIFRNLENYAVENTFAALVKDVVTHVVHLGMGGPVSSMADLSALRGAYDKFGADRIYFVHNHPSGTLKPSRQDAILFDAIKQMFGSSVEVESLIIDTTSGKFSKIEDGDYRGSTSKKPIGEDVDYEVYAFDRKVYTDMFFDIEDTPSVSSPESIAGFISSHRLGNRKKVSYLVLSNKLNIMANIHTNFNGFDDVKGVVDEMVSKCIVYGGTQIVPYGNVDLSGIERVIRGVRISSGNTVRIIDALRIKNGLDYESYYDTREEAAVYGTHSRTVGDNIAGKGEQGRSLRGDEALTALNRIFDGEVKDELPPTIPTIEKFRQIFSKPIRTFLGELIKVKDNVYNKIQKEKRTRVSGAVMPTIKNADFAMRDTDGSTLYIKRFNNNTSDSTYNIAVVNKHGEVEDYISSVHIKRDANLRNKIKNGAELLLPNKRNGDGTVSRNNSTPDAKLGKISEKSDANGTLFRDEVDGFVSSSGVDGMRERAVELGRELGADVDVVSDVSEITDPNPEVQERKRRAKGWYDAKTGRVVINLAANSDMADVEQTLLHEIVGHRGLRGLVGHENFNGFLDRIYEHASDGVRESIDDIARRKDCSKRVATEEYMSGLAEGGFADRKNAGLWQQIRQWFSDMLSRAKIKLNFSISDNELRYLLWRSHELSRMNGREGVVGRARDLAMQNRLGVGNGVGVLSRSNNSETNVAEINNTFNKELQQQIDGKLPNGHIYRMGKPGRILLSTGVPNLPIQMSAKRLQEKATMFDHDFKLSEVKNLVLELQHPLAVFEYGDKSKAQNIVVSLQQDGKNFIVGLSLNPMVNGNNLEINSIRNVFPKDNSEWLNWIGQGKSLYLDTEKVQNLIDQQRTNLADVDYLDLDSITKVIENFENPKVSDGKRVVDSYDGDLETLFRDADSPVDYERALIRDSYERRLKDVWFQSREALQDGMLSLKETMKDIWRSAGKKFSQITDIPDYANPYIGQNRLSSRNAAEVRDFKHNLFRPLLREVGRLTGFSADGRAKLTDYMMAKHGLERNKVMAERVAKAAYEAEKLKDPNTTKTLADFVAEYRKKDYSGLTSLTGLDDVAAAEAEAKNMVADYEANHDTAKLWARTKAVTDAIVEKQYDSGYINSITRNAILNMYDNYIPLRGFEDKTAEDVYSYMKHSNSAFNAPIKTARGRKSKADDPFANMLAMAESGIMRGNRNKLVKLPLLSLVLEHPTDLISVSDVWLKYNDALGEWEVVNSGDVKGTKAIDVNDTPEEVESKMVTFNGMMTALAAHEPDKYRRQADFPDIPYRVINKSSFKEHQIVITRNGRDYVLTINGNPHLAQVINGLANPDVKEDVAMKVTRYLSKIYTQLSADFAIANGIRDAIYSNTSAWVKEGRNYGLAFTAHFAVNVPRMYKLYYKHLRGTLNENNRAERLFKEFMSNGGETGYHVLPDMEQRKSDIDKELKRLNGKVSVKKAFGWLVDTIDYFNKVIENTARFSAYQTSRQFGRTVGQSINNAKEISVNFNTKGAGTAFMNSKDQKGVAKIVGYIAKYGRNYIPFFNAAIQGTTNRLSQIKHHKVAGTAQMAGMFGLGFVMGMLGFGGDDDDDDKYANIPDFVRRNNITFKVGSKTYITIPLPVEDRIIYGLGELAASIITNGERLSPEEASYQVASLFSQLLPVDFTEGGSPLTKFVPGAFKPIVEVALNQSWTGMPIYKDNVFNKNVPEYLSVYSNTSKPLVEISKYINELTGGDPYTRSVEINPAAVEYLLSAYFGGLYNLGNRALKTGETIAGTREFNPISIPVLNRLVKSPDDRTEYRQINNEFYKIGKEAEKLDKRLNSYKNDTRYGIADYADKIRTINYSPEYRYMLIYQAVEPHINKLEKKLKDNTLTDSGRKEIESAIQGLKKLVVERVWREQDNPTGKPITGPMLDSKFKNEWVGKRPESKEIFDEIAKTERGVGNKLGGEYQKRANDKDRELDIQLQRLNDRLTDEQRKGERVVGAKKEYNKSVRSFNELIDNADATSKDFEDAMQSIRADRLEYIKALVRAKTSGKR